MAPRQQGKSSAPQSSGGGGGGIGGGGGGSGGGGGGSGGGGMDSAAAHSWLGLHSRPSPHGGTLTPVKRGPWQHGCPREPHGTHCTPSGRPTSMKPPLQVFPAEHSTATWSVEATTQQAPPVAPQDSQTRASSPPTVTVLQLLPALQPKLSRGMLTPEQQGCPVAPQGGGGGAAGSTQTERLNSFDTAVRPASQAPPSAADITDD